MIIDEKKEHYGILIYISTLLFFAAMEAQAKYLSDNYTVIQIVWARYTFHFVIIILALLLLRILNFRIDFKKPRLLKVQVLRSISLLFMTYFFFASLSKLPIAEATIILFASPLITIVLSPWLLKEKVNFSTWLAVIIGFIGMIIVINPNSFSEISSIDRSWIAGIIYGILGALFYSLYQIGTRILAPKESTITSLLFSGAAGLFVTTVLILINFDPLTGQESWKFPDWDSWVLLVSVGCFGAIGQLLILWAYAKSKATTLAPISYCHIIWAVIFGYLIFNSLPDSRSIIGAALIVSAGIYAYKNIEKNKTIDN